MKQITKLRICDITLLLLTIVIFASGMQLEINPDGQHIRVWIHIIVGSVFIGTIFWHVGLHRKPHRKQTRHEHNRHAHRDPLLGPLFFFTLLSGIIATCHWIGTYIHSTIGGIHGKIGFLFIIAIILHVYRLKKFYL